MPVEGAIAAQDASLGHFRTEIAELPVDPLLRMQGYRDLARVRPRVRDIATRAAGSAQALAAPEAYYRRVAIRSCTVEALELASDARGGDAGGDTGGAGGGITFHSKRFAKVFAGCGEVMVFVLTLGPALDAETERLTERDDIVDALFLEMAGWLAVEQATKALARQVSDQVRNERLGLTRRLGPGYVDWPLDEQAGLFALLEDAPLPVRLMESCAMLPKKSRSGLYGLRPLD
ncbi:MAG: hypothetical protein O7I42_03145 [Alphaproteobacteria bacterium]|nr:hypothetical protein [Alphaproteobacteria bacterium]